MPSVNPNKNYLIIRSNSSPQPKLPATLPAAQMVKVEDIYKATPAAGLENPDFTYPSNGVPAPIVNDPSTKISFKDGKIVITDGELVQCLRKWCEEAGRNTYSATIVFTSNPGATINARC